MNDRPFIKCVVFFFGMEMLMTLMSNTNKITQGNVHCVDNRQFFNRMVLKGHVPAGISCFHDHGQELALMY